MNSPSSLSPLTSKAKTNAACVYLAFSLLCSHLSIFFSGEGVVVQMQPPQQQQQQQQQHVHSATAGCIRGVCIGCQIQMLTFPCWRAPCGRCTRHDPRLSRLFTPHQTLIPEYTDEPVCPNETGLIEAD